MTDIIHRLGSLEKVFIAWKDGWEKRDGQQQGRWSQLLKDEPLTNLKGQPGDRLSEDLYSSC